MKDKESIFITNNPYGFKININHKAVRDKYDRYKQWKGIPRGTPLSDDERFEFEAYLLGIRRKEGVLKSD